MKPITMLDLKSEFPLVEQGVRTAINEVLESQHFVGGSHVATFEEEIALRTGAKHAIAIGSGTDAILVALMAFGITSGDEVITTPFTFFATAGCIHRTGAKPVFVDINQDTFNLDPEKIKAAITPNTKAIVPVHLFGQCADMDAINDIAAKAGLKVIEDAAQALGSSYKNKNAGSLGDAACFSFYPTKNLGGFGEGGMVTTSDDALAERIRQLRNHGQTDQYHHQFIGGNFRLNTMQAAILSAKLPHLDSFNTRRRAIACQYSDLLADVPSVQTPRVAANCQSCFHQYSILTDERDKLREHLTAESIGSGIYYPIPLHLQPCFENLGYHQGDFPVSEETAKRILSLPVHPMLDDADVKRVAGCIVQHQSQAVPAEATGRS
ncbi:MAG: aminotransferase DegT/DnrJ/EryC1/StrS family protein [Phycisphaerae bacterium]|nr:MAG: aminotransferase DegT/DnrJ/EryC1/StrS family protein [Phycisphaerae bacterium]